MSDDLKTPVAREVAKQPAAIAADQTTKKVLNYLKSSCGGLPLGHLFAWPFQTPPDGAIQCNGAEYNRALYADFFAHASSKGWVKTEAEWQSIASQNNGYCSYYSDGDGSTTFRTPKFAPFTQIAIASGNVGKYHQAGLPNITGAYSPRNNVGATNSIGEASGAFYNSTKAGNDFQIAAVEGSDSRKLGFDASRSNKIYGRSTTVQPESSEWMICVVVLGIATNVGSADIGNVMSAVAQVQGDVSSKLPNSTPHIVDTWKSGESWYRKWSDGFIEQGGKLTFTGASLITMEITFNKPFASSMTGLSLMAGRNSGTYMHSDYSYGVYAYSTTKVSVTAWKDSGSSTTLWWYANGY